MIFKLWNQELSKEWSRKNSPLLPTMVGPGSHRKVIWKGKCGHEWSAVIKNRVAGAGCPYCSHNKVLAGFNDLETLYLRSGKRMVLKEIFRYCRHKLRLLQTKKFRWGCSEGHEWFTLISTRSSGSKCPYCSGIKLLKGFNDLYNDTSWSGSWMVRTKWRFASGSYDEW